MSYDDVSGKYIGYIYCVTNNFNDKRYVGQTSRTIKERWAQHKFDSSRHLDNCVFHAAIRKYGEENFSVSTVVELSNASRKGLKNLLNSYEKKYIKLYKTVCPFGYNLTHGGDNVSIRKVTPVCMYVFFGWRFY